VIDYKALDSFSILPFTIFTIAKVVNAWVLGKFH